jgi:hypothetical protein
MANYSSPRLFTHLRLSALTMVIAVPLITFSAPPNDRCDHVLPRALPMGGSLFFTGDNTGATNTDDAVQGTEVADSGLPTVWHAFTVASCSKVTIAYCGTDPVFTSHWNLLGQGCPATSFIAATGTDDAICGDGNRTLVFDGLQPGTYYIPVLSEVFGTANGPYQLTVSAKVCSGGVPPNDRCSDVAPVPIPIGGDHTFIGDNTGATFTNDGAVGTIIGSSAVPTVWHAFVLDHCASIVVDFCGTMNTQSNYWNLLAIGCPAGLTINPTQVLDDECGNGNRSMFYASLDPGVYHLPVLYDPFSGAEGPYQVRVRTGVCLGGTPPNDLCSTVQPKALAQGVPARFVGDNRGATTTDDGPPGSLIGDSGLGTVWHAFSIDRCSRITVDYCGTEEGFSNYWDLLVTACDAVSTISPVTYSDVDCSNGRRTLYFGDLTAGTYYLPVLLDAFSGSSGRYAISVLAMNCTDEGPPNDRCDAVEVLPLTELPVLFVGNNTGATVEGDGEPGGLLDTSGLPTVWHAFSTSSCQDVRVAYCGTEPVLSNYWDLLFTSCPAGDPVFPVDVNDALCSFGERTLFFNALPAGTYYLPVLLDEFSQSIGPYGITVTGTACELPTGVQVVTSIGLGLVPVPANDVIHVKGLASGAYQLRLLDLSGRMLRTWQGTHGGGSLTIAVSDLPAGHHVLWVDQGDAHRALRMSIVR